MEGFADARSLKRSGKRVYGKGHQVPNLPYRIARKIKNMKRHIFQAVDLQKFTNDLFVAVGTPQHIANDVAEILIKANLAGHDSHGVLRIPSYLEGIENGGIQPAAEPNILRETDNTLHIDGERGFGHYTARYAIRRAIKKAKSGRTCFATLIRTGHIGRLGEYGQEAAESGCIGIITVGGGSKAGGRILPFGGAVGALGTNPISIGVPTGDDRPFLIDFATSMIANGKTYVATSENRDLPEGCVVDKHGNPTVKTAEYNDGGNLLAFGRHKGYALSLYVALIGGLAGTFNIESGQMSGLHIQVVDVNAFTPLEEYQEGVRAFLDAIKAIPPAHGFDEVLVPGDFEANSRAHRLENGIDIPDTIYQQLLECAEKLDVPMAETQ